MTRSRRLVFFLLASAGVLCTVLGVWQTRRLLDRRAVNRVALARRTLPPVTLPSALADDALTERRVQVTGRYDRTREFVLRGHVYNAIPGVHLVTPLVPDSGPAILVLRGFVPAMNGLTLPDTGLDEPGPVTVTGLARPIVELGDSGEPLHRPEGSTWRYLDRAAVRGHLPYPARMVLLQRTGPATGWPRAVVEAPLDDGPHLNYLLQWYAMAAVALATLGVIAFRAPPPPAP